MPETLREGVMRLAQGASAIDPTAIDRNPNKEEILSLRKGLWALLNAKPKDLVGKPRIILEVSPKRIPVLGVLATPELNNPGATDVFVLDSDFRNGSGDPIRRLFDLPELKIGMSEPFSGLSGQPERVIRITGAPQQINTCLATKFRYL